jgi:hypothetical protein
MVVCQLLPAAMRAALGLGMTARRFPPPWSAEETEACYIVRDGNEQCEKASPMPRTPPDYERYVDADDSMAGFSGIALGFWRTAEKLRDEAEKETAGQGWRTHSSIHSAICLYHAALECFINEEITFSTARLETKKLTEAYRIQGETLNAKKLDGFWSFFGLSAKATPDVTRRAALLANLRKRLYHHWPVLGDERDYPTDVVAALEDAQIARVNASWAAQCSDVLLAEWAAKVVRGFVDEWWRLGRAPAQIELLHWDYGPHWRYPSEKVAASAPES